MQFVPLNAMGIGQYIKLAENVSIGLTMTGAGTIGAPVNTHDCPTFSKVFTMAM